MSYQYKALSTGGDLWFPEIIDTQTSNLSLNTTHVHGVSGKPYGRTHLSSDLTMEHRNCRDATHVQGVSV